MIYVNDLSDELLSNTKLLTDDTSLFSVVRNTVEVALQLNVAMT